MPKDRHHLRNNRPRRHPKLENIGRPNINPIIRQYHYQAGLLKAAFTPFPRSADKIVPYLKRVFTLVFSREGALMGLEALTVAFIVLFILLSAMFSFFKQDLSSLGIFAPNLPGSVTYYDRTGKIVLWQDYNSVKRVPVSSNQISNYVKEATVAIEDKNFYHEGAFSTVSIARAALHDITHLGGGLQGASTITEQVVKMNKGWSDPLSISEKFEELALSVEMAHEYSKNQILTAYLNIAPYGNIDYGVQAAAKDYFNENASQLTLAQSAMLAAIPQAPTAYSPFSSSKYNPAVTANYFDPADLLARQQYILQQMVSQHMISQRQADQAKKVNILAEIQPLHSKFHNITAPYFVLAAKQQLLQQYGLKMLKHGAWRVVTTLSMPLQQLANNEVQNNIPNIEAFGADEEALVAEQVKTGQVVALVGGTNFNNPNYGQINYAQTNISPGSSIKPYVYSTFINNPKHNAGAGSVLYDIQQPLPGYPCTNKNPPTNGGNCLEDYDYRYPGPVTIRYALAGSRNVPAVKAGLMSGLSNVQSTADAMMGVKNAYLCFPPGTNVETATAKQQSPCYGSAAIGEGGYLHLDQTVNGLSTLARLGQEIPQTYILNIKNAADQNIYSWKQPKPKQVINPNTAYIVNNILSDPNASYLPGYCNTTYCSPLSSGGYKWQRYNGWDIAIKTGTTHANISGLMTAWTTQYAVGTWVSYHSVNKPLTAGGMEYMTEPLARGWMQGALSMLKTKPVNWTQPTDIRIDPAYVIRNHVGLGSVEPSPSTDIFPSWYKPKVGQGKAVVIDRVSGLLATACTPNDAKQTIYNDNAAAFSVDQFVTGKNSIPTAYDNIHHCSDQKPSITITPPPNGTCSNTDNSGQGCLITATITQGTYPLSSGKIQGSAVFSINGQTINSTGLGSSPQTINFYFQPTQNGSVTLTGTVTDSALYQTTSSISFTTTYIAPAPKQSPSSPVKQPKNSKKNNSTGTISSPTTGGL
jgi:membrane peptidoglycan carboxypeptidase